MKQWIEEYKRKLRTPEEAVRVVKSGDWIDYGMAASQPVVLDEALSKRKGELKDIKIRGAFTFSPRRVAEVDPKRETFTYTTWHMSGYERSLWQHGACSFSPMTFRNKPSYYRKYLNVDVVMITVAPMDKQGWFSFGLNNSANRAILDKAKTIIVEVNEAMPRCLGGSEEAVHISEVDYVVEAGSLPIATIPFTAGNDIDNAVAVQIVEDIPNGATIQLGVGGMPNAVGAMIADSDLKDLGMHTEMLVDAFYLMAKKGRLTNRLKEKDRGKGTYTFAVGSQEMYDWMDDNPGLASYPVDYINDPAVIGQFKNFISINNCVEVDLYGQVSSESSGIRHISGSGGQLDFVDGAYRSEGGRSYICFSSTFVDKKTGSVKSRIVPTLLCGTAITVPRSQANWFVTEYGKVNMAGASLWERAERLISIAHPDFREELIQEAQKLNIWRYSNKR